MTKNQQIFNIRETVEILVPDGLGRTSYIISFALIISMSLAITILFGKLPIVVPLYFTLPWGESRLAPKIMLFLLPMTNLLFMTINLILGRMATKLSPLLPRVLAVSTAIISAMIVISLIGIVQSLIL